MQLNVTTDYAIRIVLYLAIKKEITTSKEIGAAMGIPKNYVLKITHKLVEAGIIERLVGAQGGFSLAQKIDDITLLDILNIMEPTMRLTVVWKRINSAAVMLLKIVRSAGFTASCRKN